MRYLKEFYRFLKHLKDSRKLIFVLAYNDFKEQYLGSYLGILWAVLRPALFIGVIWFVFTFGFKAKPTDDNIQNITPNKYFIEKGKNLKEELANMEEVKAFASGVLKKIIAQVFKRYKTTVFIFYFIRFSYVNSYHF